MAYDVIVLNGASSAGMAHRAEQQVERRLCEDVGRGHRSED